MRQTRCGALPVVDDERTPRRAVLDEIRISRLDGSADGRVDLRIWWDADRPGSVTGVTRNGEVVYPAG